ncbi:uncharacterized protein DUF4920 [Tenacibaculum skagerrakense]|uniref:Uncharacterized protein DUF4920 n=1 Tax=Tenacibaculum skagerrakense TaxID=186571 RepID=A0A4R2P2Q6_9FLAO|nr:DUF4920 domain-containing protein [Tenacibaculum skagerrakense]TCP28418.1 uncharacterized protein DUF4920 [Tenacibaculum skagerrakense]
MKNLLILFCGLFLALISCKSEKKETPTEKETIEVTYASFGEKISEEGALSKEQAYEKYNSMNIGDTLTVKFATKINEVCSKKGCWMKVPVSDSEEVMVRFKDYGFFMPLDSNGKEVIIEGKAFIQETSVEDLKHYAKDAGKSEEEIAKITEPKKEKTFLAHGVLLK